MKTGVVVDMSQNGYTYGEIEAGPHSEVFAFSGELGIRKYNTASELIDHFPAGGSTIFGIDPVSGDLLSVRYEHAADFDPNGNELPGIDYSEEPRSVAIDGIDHRTYFGYGGRVDLFQPQPAVTIPGAQPEPPTNIEPTSLTLNALVEPEGAETTKCNFEIGTVFEYGTVYYEESVPCEQGQVIDGGAPTPVSAALSGLSQGATYHYRLVLTNANGTFKSKDRTVLPSGKPVVESPYVDTVHSDSVVFHAEITPEGAPTTFHVLYGTGDCNSEPETCEETPETSSIGSALNAVPVTANRAGLQAGTTYHYAIVATNQSGSTEAAESTFTTFPYTPVLRRQMRQRTRSPADRRRHPRRLPGVRAGLGGGRRGYDVESYLTPGQEPVRGLSRCAEPAAGPLRGPRRRDPRQRPPDQPRARSLRRDPRRGRLEHLLRRHAGQPAVLDRSLRLAAGRRRRVARHLRLRRAGPLLAVLRGRQHRGPGGAARRLPRPGHAGVIADPARARRPACS